MRVEKTVNPDGSVDEHYIADPGEHVVLTGPINGIKTLADGTSVNVTPPVVAVSSKEKATELSDLIGQHWVDNGHPHDIDVIEHPETGEQVAVQRPFVHVNSKGETVTGKVGHDVGEHPVEKAVAKAATSRKGA